MTSWRVAAAVAFLAVALVSTALPRAGAQTPPIKVGVLFDHTGPFAAAGALDSWRGVKLAIDYVNDKGGVLDRYRIVQVDADTRSKTDVAVAEADRLLTMEKVDILTGVFASAHAMRLADTVERQKRFFWITAAVSDAVFRNRNLRYTFRPRLSSDMIGELAVQYVAYWAPEKLGKPAKDVKPAIIHEDGAYGTAVAAENENEAKRLGMQVVLKEGYPASVQDFSALIAKLKAVRPEVLLHAGYDADVALFARQARTQALKVRVMMGHGRGHTRLSALRDALGPDVEGFHAVDSVAAQRVDPRKLRPEAAAATQEMVRRYRKEFGEGDVPAHVSTGFTATWILLTDVVPRAIEKYGGVGGEALAKAARETDIPDGGTPQGYGVSFHPPGHALAGQNARAFAAVSQVVDGRFVLVFPRAIATATPVMPLPPSSPFALPPDAPVGPPPKPVPVTPAPPQGGTTR